MALRSAPALDGGAPTARSTAYDWLFEPDDAADSERIVRFPHRIHRRTRWSERVNGPEPIDTYERRWARRRESIRDSETHERTQRRRRDSTSEAEALPGYVAKLVGIVLAVSVLG